MTKCKRKQIKNNRMIRRITPPLFCIDAPIFLIIQKSRIFVADTAILRVFQNILRPINYEESLEKLKIYVQLTKLELNH